MAQNGLGEVHDPGAGPGQHAGDVCGGRIDVGLEGQGVVRLLALGKVLERGDDLGGRLPRIDRVEHHPDELGHPAVDRGVIVLVHALLAGQGHLDGRPHLGRGMPGGVEPHHHLPGRAHERGEALVAVQYLPLAGEPDHAQGGILEDDPVPVLALAQDRLGLQHLGHVVEDAHQRLSPAYLVLAGLDQHDTDLAVRRRHGDALLYPDILHALLEIRGQIVGRGQVGRMQPPLMHADHLLAGIAEEPLGRPVALHDDTGLAVRHHHRVHYRGMQGAEPLLALPKPILRRALPGHGPVAGAFMHEQQDQGQAQEQPARHADDRVAPGVRLPVDVVQFLVPGHGHGDADAAPDVADLVPQPGMAPEAPFFHDHRPHVTEHGLPIHDRFPVILVLRGLESLERLGFPLVGRALRIRGVEADHVRPVVRLTRHGLDHAGHVCRVDHGQPVAVRGRDVPLGDLEIGIGPQLVRNLHIQAAHVGGPAAAVQVPPPGGLRLGQGLLQQVLPVLRLRSGVQITNERPPQNGEDQPDQYVFPESYHAVLPRLP